MISTRPSHRTAAVALAATIALAACGDAASNSDDTFSLPPVTTSTPATDSVPVPTTAATATTTVTVAPTTTEAIPTTTVPERDLVDVPPTGPLQIDEIQSAAYMATELTDDVMESLSVFAPMPDRISTPGESRIVSFDVGTRDNLDLVYLDASVTFLTAGSQADILTYYETTMVQNGYTVSGSDQRDVGDVTVDSLFFDDPNGDPDFFLRELIVSVAESTVEGLREVSIDVTDDVDGIDPTRLATWPTEIPGLDGVGFQDGRVELNAFDQSRISMFARAEVPDYTVVDQQLTAAMPADGWSITESSSPLTVELEHDGFEFPTVYFTDLDDRDFVDPQLSAPFDISGVPNPEPGSGVPVDRTKTATGTAPTVSPVVDTPIAESEFADIAADIVGETTDPLGALAPLTAAIQGLPTPDGTVIESFLVTVRPRSGNPGTLASNTVTTRVPASYDDLVTFYDTSMTAAGFNRVGSQDLTSSGGLSQQSLTFAIPGSVDELGEITITIADTDDDRIVEIQSLDVVEGLTPTRLGGWTANVPGATGFEPESASVSYSPITEEVSLDAGNEVEDAAALDAAIRAAMPANGYTFEPSDTDDTLRFLFEGAPGRVAFSENLDREFAYFYLDVAS